MCYLCSISQVDQETNFCQYNCIVQFCNACLVQFDIVFLQLFFFTFQQNHGSLCLQCNTFIQNTNKCDIKCPTQSRLSEAPHGTQFAVKFKRTAPRMQADVHTLPPPECVYLNACPAWAGPSHSLRHVNAFTALFEDGRVSACCAYHGHEACRFGWRAFIFACCTLSGQCCSRKFAQLKPHSCQTLLCILT